MTRLDMLYSEIETALQAKIYGVAELTQGKAAALVAKIEAIKAMHNEETKALLDIHHRTVCEYIASTVAD